VLDAVLALVAESGYGAVTIEAVAARSGVAKSTIYRHWPGRAELVNDAFRTLQPPVYECQGGDVRSRVDVWLPVTSIRAKESRFAADWSTKNNFWWLELVARLHANATPTQAEAMLTTTFARVNLGGDVDDATVRERARVAWGPLLAERGPKRDDNTRVATWLAAIAGIVLLLACSNVAN
jgi:AcrR family transcriptional regulator